MRTIIISCALLVFLTWVASFNHGILCTYYATLRYENNATRTALSLAGSGCALGLSQIIDTAIISSDTSYTCELLARCCESGSVQTLNVVLNRPFNLASCDNSTIKYHPLHSCARRACVRCCEILLERGADPSYVVNGSFPFEMVPRTLAGHRTAVVIIKTLHSLERRAQ